MDGQFFNGNRRYFIFRSLGIIIQLGGGYLVEEYLGVMKRGINLSRFHVVTDAHRQLHGTLFAAQPYHLTIRDVESGSIVRRDLQGISHMQAGIPRLAGLRGRIIMIKVTTGSEDEGVFFTGHLWRR